MKILILLLICFVSLGCKKQSLPSYQVKIETTGYFYAVKVETTDGAGLVYLNKKDQGQSNTYTVTPRNGEDVSVFYTCVSNLAFKIYINNKLVINQTQVEGSGLFLLKKP